MSLKGQVLQLSSDEEKAIRQIKHDPKITVEEREILRITNEFLSKVEQIRTLQGVAAGSQVANGKANEQAMTSDVISIVHKIGCELSCSSKTEIKSIIGAVFDALENYAWEVKGVLALAAFIMRYGEFRLLSQLHASNAIAQYVHLFKPFPDISDRESLVIQLLKVLAAAASCIIELTEFPREYLPTNTPPLSEAFALFPAVVYWAIKSIVTCSTQIIGLRHGYLLKEDEARTKVADLTETLNSYCKKLKEHRELCEEYIDEKKKNRIYHEIEKKITNATNSVDIFIALTCEKPSMQFLYFGIKKVSDDELKGKTVIFFFSYHDISNEEIEEIKQQAGAKETRQYEIVWFPIINESAEVEKINDVIQEKACLMSWYALHYPFKFDEPAIRYIRKNWRFKKQSLMVVSNAEGKIICENAYPMMMLWGSKAFPFTTQRMETLWQQTSWSLPFLVDEADREQLVSQGTVVCFYGGQDVEWVKKIVDGMNEVKKRDKINFELIYVGTKLTNRIKDEILESKCWDSWKVRRFHNRLNDIFSSKMHLGKPIEEDPIMKDVITLLGCEGGGRGWAIIGHGSDDLLVMKENAATCWLDEAKKTEEYTTFHNFFANVFHKVRDYRRSDGKHCYHIVFPGGIGILRQKLRCVDCGRLLEKNVVYSCCND